MKYFSIATTTTGQSTESGQIVELAAIYDNGAPLNELPKFHTYLVRKSYIVDAKGFADTNHVFENMIRSDSYSLSYKPSFNEIDYNNRRAQLPDEITEFERIHLNTLAINNSKIQEDLLQHPSQAIRSLSDFTYYWHQQTLSIEKRSDKSKPVIAGVNFIGNDLPFLQKEGFDFSRYNPQILDPGILYMTMINHQPLTFEDLLVDTGYPTPFAVSAKEKALYTVKLIRHKLK